MHIGIAGPIDLAPLRDHLGGELPDVYRGPSTGWLARTWLDQGHRVTAYALSSSATGTRVLGSGPLRVVVVPQRPRVRDRVRDLLRAERRALATAMRAHPAEVVNAHWTYEFALAAIASGRPAFVTARDTPLRYAWEMRSSARWARHTLAVPAVHRATAVSANSPYTARHLRRCLGVRRPIAMIPNGVRDGDLPASAAADPGAAPVFACAVQGWGRLKNTESVLRALPLVRRRLPGARLLLFGTGHGPGAEAHRWALRHGLADGVEFAGRLERDELLGRLARQAHILVHPSRVESFSMICAEALGMGLPVIAGRRAGAVPWVVGDAGVLCDITDHRALATAMTRLALDPGMRRRMAAAGPERVREHFRLEDSAAAYVTWMQKELGR